jgi:hypothetical protein
MQIKKYVKIGVSELAALALILVATLLRVLLVVVHWPLFNSDEGTMGLMALHIAFRGEHPIFYYGQHYMGTLDAYLAVGLFRVLGPSILTLRLGIILLYVPFLLVMYGLTRLLYTKTFALGCLLVLSLGSIPILILEVTPIGGYAEILLLGACAFLIACWLTLSSKQDGVQHRPWVRWLGYAGWGVVAGLAVWSDPLILPYLAAAGVLLLLFCWRELLGQGGGLCLLLGLVLGASPLLLYNLTAPPGQDSLSILIAQARPGVSVPGHFSPFSVHVLNAILYNIPTATGDPFCPLVLSQGPVNTPGLRCTILHASWSLGLIVLWLVAVWLALQALWTGTQELRGQPASWNQTQSIKREGARLLLLLSAGLTVVVFTLSAASIASSAGYARYLHCLLISVPAVLWPLWRGARKLAPAAGVCAQSTVVVSRGLLLLVGLLCLAGTIAACVDVSSVRSIEQQHEAVMNKLESMHIQHFYTDDYWTCYRMAFASREKLTCAVIGSNLRPGGPDRNRYWPYVLQVQADPHVAYVLPINDPQTLSIVRNAHLANGKYLRVDVDGYVIYQPALG